MTNEQRPQPDGEKHTAKLLIPKLNSDARIEAVGWGEQFSSECSVALGSKTHNCIQDADPNFSRCVRTQFKNI